MSKREIMIVDDQPSTCKEISAYLHNDYAVHAFKSGAEAMRYLGNHQVDLILLDYYMPEMTGFEVLLNILQNKATEDIPVVFLTAEVNDRMEIEMMQRGAVGYLCKPVDANKLRQTVAKHMPAQPRVQQA